MTSPGSTPFSANTPPTAGAAPRPDSPPSLTRARITLEVWLIMGLSLGKSGVYAAVALIDSYTRGPIGEQTTTLNPALHSRPWFDLTYQLLAILFALIPVLLAVYLVSLDRRPALPHLGLDGHGPFADVGWAFGLAAIIGIPGLGVYLIGRAWGVGLNVATSGLNPVWWTIPVLILSALKNGVLEEVLVVGYLTERLRRLHWGHLAIAIASSAIRASYHLYQGWGALAGNFAMGLVFSGFYLRKGRLWPLIIAHTLIDVVAFVGYAYLPEAWLTWLGIG